MEPVGHVQINAKHFYEATTKLTDLIIVIKTMGLTHDEDGSPTHIDDHAFKDHIYLLMASIHQSLAEIDAAPITIKALLEFRQSVQKDERKSWEWSVILLRAEEVRSTLRRELESVTFFALSKREKNYFYPAEPLFGSAFAEKFKAEAVFEADEAAKCLAVGRPIACVFHLMRAMEVGLRAIARCLQIPDPVKPAERNWAFILKGVRDGIEARWPKTSDRAKGDGALFEELCALLGR